MVMVMLCLLNVEGFSDKNENCKKKLKIKPTHEQSVWN